MQLQLSGVHYDISDQTREYVEKKIARLDRMADSIEDVKVTLIREAAGYTVEANLNFVWGGDTVHVERQEKDLWPAIDGAFDKLDIKVGKEKARHDEAQRG